MGGLYFLSKMEFSSTFEWSRAISDPLENREPEVVKTKQYMIIRNIKFEKQNIALSKNLNLLKFAHQKKRTKSLASQKGASNWLSVLPLKMQFFSHQIRIRDASHLIYGWKPPKTPHKRPRGKPLTLIHSLLCPKGGYTHLRHTENRDTLATLLDEVCHGVGEEPKLQSLEGESFHNKTTTTEDDARLDIKQMDSGEVNSAELFSM